MSRKFPHILQYLWIQKNAKIVIWHKKEFDQPDVPWLRDTSNGDIYLSESAKSALELFQKFFADELCGLLADQNNICHMTKTGRASDVTKEETSWDKYHHG